MKHATVAAIQATSENGRIERNLDNAAPLVARAAEQGAQLVVCPEFLGAGYVFHERIWDAGEPADGPKEQWLAQLAARHGIALGAVVKLLS